MTYNMRQVTLNIPDSEYNFFMKVVENFHFVQVEESVQGDSKEEIIENIKAGMEELKLYKEGKLELRPAKDLLNEL